MKYTTLLAIAVSAAILSGCTTETTETEVTETTSETSATTFNQYILTRGWDGNELLESIFYLGEYHPLPMSIEDKPDYTLSDGFLYFPDGSYARAAVDEDGRIVALNLSADTAPDDFSIYGIDFSSRPSEISEKVGFANAVVGNEEEDIMFEFTGGGISQLTFKFSQKKLIAVYIHA